MNPNANYINTQIVDRQKRKTILTVLAVLSVIVTLIVFWSLKLTGITFTGEALCELSEHTHDGSCYEYTLICTDEDETHEHTADCVNEELICIITEHTHTRECYEDVGYDEPEFEDGEVSEDEVELPGFFSSGHDTTYISHLEDEVVGIEIIDQKGTVIWPPGTGKVYIGEHYRIVLEFREINSGNEWIQFENNENDVITYQIPTTLVCEEFDSWHTITAKTDEGTVYDVGEYFVHENGLLEVRFFEDSDGVLFFDKYTNTDFFVEFEAVVGDTTSDKNVIIDFGNEVEVNVQLDGSAAMDVTKTHSNFDSANNQVEYTIKVEATQGVIKDLVIDDQIWKNHYTLRDTIVVTDLEGNVLNPQPTISNHPNQYASGGFRLSDFPDFSKGEGFLIKYKTQIHDYLLSNETVDMWNGLDVTGKNGKGEDVYVWAEDWLEAELSKMEKEGTQSVIKDNNGNDVSVIEWEVEIKNSTSNMNGTVVIDTLGDGLQYYTGEAIRVKRYDANGDRLSPDAYISWSDVDINGNRMEFELPSGYAFDIIYYTTYQAPPEGETDSFTNRVQTTVNGVVEGTTGNADVIGITPRVAKTAWGNDGEYVNFKVSIDAQAVLKDKGYFYLTDLAAFWGYDNEAGHLYVDNKPEDMKVTVTLKTGEVITYTPYVEGGPTENTYIVLAPAPEGKETLYHTFKVLFNTATATEASSKWIHDVNGTVDIEYKIPFSAETGTEWYGTPDYGKTLEDILLEDYRMANEAYFNYTKEITITSAAYYSYNPPIIKKADVGEDGIVNYTVIFNNTVPGSDSQGYLNSTVDNAYFIDTFDEKLEYVPGSLMVTGYSPYQQGLWLAKYKYNGSISGNTINVSARDFLMYDYNEEADAYNWNGLSGTATFRNYYRWVNRGGKMVFTYQLKLKDKYMNTTDFSHYIVDNTAEVTWDNGGTSGPVTEETEIDTGILDKAVEQIGDRLIFEVIVNEKGKDLLAEKDTLTVVDDMSPNLSVYWNTIKLRYKNANGEWIDFDSPESKYTYDVVYDAEENMLSFTIPDSLPVIIDYTTLVTESGTVSIKNTVKVDGKAQVSDFIDAEFTVTNHGGGASGSVHSFTLIKQDGITNERLPNAKFALYSIRDHDIIPDAGEEASITLADGTELYYIDTFTTGEDGTKLIENQYLVDGGPYALVELEAPVGYQLLQNPVEFYFFSDDPDGVSQTVTTLLAIHNFNIGGELLPETGSVGTLPFTICGGVLMALPLLYCIQKRRKERRRIFAKL